MLSKTELKILYQISIGLSELNEIAKAIKKSNKQIYRECRKLKEINYIEMKRGKIIPVKLPHVNLILQSLRENDNLIDLLSGTGITILSKLLLPKTISEIAEETGLKKSIIYLKIKNAMHVGLVINKEGYSLNNKLWPKTVELFEELNRINQTVDERVPANSEIFYKNDKEIIFSNSGEIDAEKTAFSVYGDYGIKLFLLTNYYYLPRKKLTKNDIILHSIYIAEKSGIREKIFMSLFYIKFIKKITLKHQVLDKINLILKGEKIEGFPTLAEIKSRCDEYDIRFWPN